MAGARGHQKSQRASPELGPRVREDDVKECGVEFSFAISAASKK
jgi:hypothetical protein